MAAIATHVRAEMIRAYMMRREKSPPLEGELEVEEFDVREFATAFVQAALEVVAILCR